MKYDSIIFDLDGTLWDSTKEVALSWGNALKQFPEVHNIPTIDDLKSVMGMASVELMSTLFPYLETKRGQEIFNYMCKIEIEYLNAHGAPLYPAVDTAIAKLAEKVPLFIVSNCNDGYIECFLHSSGLGAFFKDWECIGRSGLPKSDNIRLVVERNRLSSPVYIGDTALDHKSASSANVPFIWASYGFGYTDSTESITSIEELLQKV